METLTPLLRKSTPDDFYQLRTCHVASGRGNTDSPAVGGHHPGNGSVGSHKAVDFGGLLHLVRQSMLQGEGKEGAMATALDHTSLAIHALVR